MRARRITGSSLLDCLWLIMLLGVPWPGAAQTSGIAADIVVVATDETGAVLPGVTVTVTSNTTGVSRTLVTDDKGWVLAASVQPGSYKVSSELAGFATVTLSQVTVALSQRANLSVQMKVASVAENVTVSGESAGIVETTKTEVSSLINERAIQELPINVRNPLQFISHGTGTDHPADDDRQRLLVRRQPRPQQQLGARRRGQQRRFDPRVSRTAVARRGARVPGDGEQLLRRVRPCERRSREHDPEVGHEPVPWQRLLLHPGSVVCREQLFYERQPEQSARLQARTSSSNSPA